MREAKKIPTTNGVVSRRRLPASDRQTPAARTLPAGSDQPTLPALPGPGAIAQLVAQLWEHHDALDKATVKLGKAGKEVEAEAHYIAGNFVFKQIVHLEDLGTVTPPRTLFDAAGHLLLIHAAIYSAAVNQTNESEGKIISLLENSVWSLAILARQAGFDLPSIGRAHLTNNEMMIARGEVPA